MRPLAVSSRSNCDTTHQLTRESRTPTLAYRNRGSNARAVLHRAPDSYVHEWRATILVEGYPVWSRGFATKGTTWLRDELEKRPQPELRCPECPNDEVVVGQKSADGAKIQRWFECRECGYESRSAIVYAPER
jgi:DNA-directed RNA polymerase subunit M/transcription elongation factor TFIIS